MRTQIVCLIALIALLSITCESKNMCSSSSFCKDDQLCFLKNINQYVCCPAQTKYISSINKCVDVKTFIGGHNKAIIPILTQNLKSSNESSLKIIEQIFQGLAEVLAVDWNVVAQAVDCIDDADQMVENFTQAVKLIETNTPANILKAITIIGDTIAYIPIAMKQCQVAEQDAEKWLKWIQGFTNPWEFFYDMIAHLLVNGINIYDQFMNAKNDWNNQNYTGFGEEIGEILLLLFGNVTQTQQLNIQTDNNLQIVLEIFQGVVEGLKEDWSLIQNVDKCIDNADEIVQNLTTAVKLIETNVPANVLQAISLIGGAIEELPNDMIQCGIAQEEAKQWIQVIENFKNPWEFFYDTVSHLLINGKEVYKQFFDAKDAWKAEQYQQFGEDIGQILWLLWGNSTTIIQS